MDYSKKPPIILSYCPGILGLERGIERAFKIRGWQKPVVAAYLEIEMFLIENLLKGMEAGLLAPSPIWSDIKTFNPEPFHGKVHGIIGGYPCPPFSVAGKRKGTEDPRHLWPYLLKHIQSIQPVWCFFENVRGHLSLGYDEVYRSLSEAGYSVEPGIYSAAEVGAPHKRERLFILAIKRDYLAYAHSTRNRWDNQQRLQPEIIGGSKSAELGNSQHDGHVTCPQCGRSKEDCTGCKEREDTAKQLTGTDRPTDRRDIRGIEMADTQRRCGDTRAERTGREKGADTGRRGTGSSMADTNYCRSGENIQSGQLRTNSVKQSSCNSWISDAEQNAKRGFDRWPAPPGKPQHQWEEPRTIEPRLGSSVNGYNFREDFLRALGNSVVEQTAALAFTDLLNKHGL